MAAAADGNDSGKRWKSRRNSEILTFLVLAFGIWPLAAIAVVGGFGFVIWMWQLVFGPPGPPAGFGA